jgi:hypothetical protein
MASKGTQTDPEVRVLREPNECAPAAKAASSNNVQNSSLLDTGLRSRTTAAATPSAASSNDELVCVIGSGGRYHRRTCGMVNAQQNRARVRTVGKRAAVSAGYTACKQCLPG